jgi:hypothetical protein
MNAGMLVSICLLIWLLCRWSHKMLLQQVSIAPSLIHIFCSSLQHVLSLLSLLQPFLSKGFQQRTFPFLWVPKLSLSSATSFSQQQLTTTEPQQSSGQLHWLHFNSQTGGHLTPTSYSSGHFSRLSTCPAYNVSGWTAQKTPLLTVAVQLLPSGLHRKHYSSIACRLLPRNGWSVSWSLPSNGSTCHNVILQTVSTCNTVHLSMLQSSITSPVITKEAARLHWLSNSMAWLAGLWSVFVTLCFGKLHIPFIILCHWSIQPAAS